MGAIREAKKKDGSVTYHAEVRLKDYPPQRESFRTRTLAKKWIQDTDIATFFRHREHRFFKFCSNSDKLLASSPRAA
jgi:hypothetical protein